MIGDIVWYYPVHSQLGEWALPAIVTAEYEKLTVDLQVFGVLNWPLNGVVRGVELSFEPTPGKYMVRPR